MIRCRIYYIFKCRRGNTTKIISSFVDDVFCVPFSFYIFHIHDDKTSAREHFKYAVSALCSTTMNMFSVCLCVCVFVPMRRRIKHQALKGYNPGRLMTPRRTSSTPAAAQSITRSIHVARCVPHYDKRFYAYDAASLRFTAYIIICMRARRQPLLCGSYIYVRCGLCDD